MLVRTARRMLATAFIGILAWSIGAFHGVRANAQWADLHPPIPRIIEGLAVALDLCRDHPRPVLIACAVLACLLLVSNLAALLPHHVSKDPQRAFTSDQRRTGFQMAGGRCEMESVFFTRCNRPAEHGDHWFPHSRGGATEMSNFVAACQPHNTAKGARVPTFWETLRLERRRRRYYPAHLIARPHGTYQSRT